MPDPTPPTIKRISPSLLVRALRYKDAAQPTPAEQGVRERFLAAYPELADKIAAYQADPRCPCAGEILKTIMADPAKLKQAVPTIMADPTVALVIPQMISGQVLICENTPQAYQMAIQGLQQGGASFRGMSVMESSDGTKLKLFFY